MSAPLLEYSVSARRLDSHSSEASCKSARLALDTDLAGNPQAFNPAELLHQNVRRYGTVFNTVAPGTELSGTLRRA
jgi:hypothetical protein